MRNTPLVLAILDGFGCSKNGCETPLDLASMPFYRDVLNRYPHTTLAASGLAVGLPQNQDGNSEAGHMNIGAGRVVDSDSVIISKTIEDGSFFENPVLLAAAKNVKKQGSKLHLVGLLSGGQSAHAELEHLFALIMFYRLQRVQEVFIHLFTDGRDSPPISALSYLDLLLAFLQPHENIATIMGRFYAMDRKKEWSRTQKAYELLTQGKGIASYDARSALLLAYSRGETDEYIYPTVILNDEHRFEGVIDDHDSVVFFHLRSDRARQLTKPFVQKEFEQFGGFQRSIRPKDLCFVALTNFGPFLDHIMTAYVSPIISNPLPLALNALRQLYIAESEKYAHITYFFNGGNTNSVAHEERVMIPSPDVSDYSSTPGMSVEKVHDVVIRGIKEKQFDFIALNISSPDMIGHTGDMASAVRALEIVDKELKRLYDSVKKAHGTLIITADHGNVEEMLDPVTRKKDTKHSSNPVPFILLAEDLKHLKLKKGRLGNVAPTILDILGLEKPREMTLDTLIID